MFAVGLLLVLVLWLLGIGIGFLGLIFWVWMLIDCATDKTLEGTDKIVWILILIFLPVLGSIIYFFVHRSKRAK